jgi:hypothetical protein
MESAKTVKHPERGIGFDWGLIVVALVMALLFWARMDLAMSTPYLTYDSYLSVRSVDNLHQTGFPLRIDPLSITGHERITNPAFEYLLALVTWISPLAYKVLPNLFMVLLLLPVYLIARRLTKSRLFALVAVILAGTGPLLFARYIATPSPVPLAIFLLLSALSLLHDADKHMFLLVFCLIALAFLHPIIFVLALALLIMMLLLRVEGFDIGGRINEVFFFTLLLAVWFYVLVYKKALFAFGINTLWQNLPNEYLVSSFGSVSPLTMLYGLGIVTFLFGTVGVYHALFETRDRESYTVVAAIIAAVFLFVVRAMPVDLSLVLLTPLLAIMASYGVQVIGTYLRRTRIRWSVYPLTFLLIVFFIFSALIPALANAHRELNNVPTEGEVTAYRALGQILPESAVLLTTVREAVAVQYYSGHRTVTDEDFLLVHNGNELVNDIDAVYTARFVSNVLGKADKLGFDSILFSPEAQRQYARDQLLIDSSSCVTSTRAGTAQLYTITCHGGTA